MDVEQQLGLHWCSESDGRRKCSMDHGILLACIWQQPLDWKSKCIVRIKVERTLTLHPWYVKRTLQSNEDLYPRNVVSIIRQAIWWQMYMSSHEKRDLWFDEPCCSINPHRTDSSRSGAFSVHGTYACNCKQWICRMMAWILVNLSAGTLMSFSSSMMDNRARM